MLQRSVGSSGYADDSNYSSNSTDRQDTISAVDKVAFVLDWIATFVNINKSGISAIDSDYAT